MLVGVLLAAFNLRIAITEVGPVLHEIRVDTGMSRALAGTITTIPFFCMGFFAFFGAVVIARLGAKRLIGWCLLVIAVATTLRAVAPTGGLILAATLPIGIAIALAGVAVPAVIKTHLPGRGGGGTGAYVSAMNLGGAVASLTVVPLAAGLGGWRQAFAATALPAAVALAVWARTDLRDDAPPPLARPRILRRPPPRAIVLALIFGCQALGFAGLIAWVAVIYREAGWSAGDAALATTAIVLVAVPASLIVPAVSDGRDRRLWLAGGAAVMAAGLVGIALVPTTLAWLWLVLFALGNGAVFPLALTLPLDLSRDAREAAELVAWTLGLGYLLSALAPVLIGVLRDATGGFGTPMLVLALVGVVCGVLAVVGIPAGAGRHTSRIAPMNP